MKRGDWDWTEGDSSFPSEIYIRMPSDEEIEYNNRWWRRVLRWFRSIKWKALK